MILKHTANHLYPAVCFQCVLIIRRVEPDDIFPVIALAFDTLPERYNPTIFSRFYESFPEGFLVAYHSDLLLGFLVGIKTTPSTARILMLAVKDTHRKQRIGSALLEQFLREMRAYQVTGVELEVRTSNQGALRFYQRCGFIIQEMLPRFYQNGEDAYSMRKEL
jgi:[ribosomal protein S18]-alanine N-acetyltransferase